MKKLQGLSEMRFRWRAIVFFYFLSARFEKLFLLYCGAPTHMSDSNLKQLPVRAYIDETVAPVLMQALAAVSRERPDDPVDFVAHYLLKNNPRKLQEAKKAVEPPR